MAQRERENSTHNLQWPEKNMVHRLLCGCEDGVIFTRRYYTYFKNRFFSLNTSTSFPARNIFLFQWLRNTPFCGF